MQPTYLPWSGYFNLIDQVDRFVFLDDVQFERQSWQTRNRVLLQGREHWLIVPVNSAPLGTRIDAITISDRSDWKRAHWLTLKAAYGKAKHGAEALRILEPFYAEPTGSKLSELNQAIVMTICGALGIEKTFCRASDLNCGGKRSMHLINICEALGCDEYVSPRGSMQYLEEDDFTGIGAIKLGLQDYSPASYPQYRSAAFVSHLSIVDVIANNGIGFARSYVS